MKDSTVLIDDAGPFRDRCGLQSVYLNQMSLIIWLNGMTSQWIISCTVHHTLKKVLQDCDFLIFWFSGFWFPRRCRQFIRPTHSPSTINVAIHNILLISCHNPRQKLPIFALGKQGKTGCDSPFSLICGKLMWNTMNQLSDKTQRFQWSFDCCPMNV